MPKTMKCPFLEKDGEYSDCYGKSCMAYYEIKTVDLENRNVSEIVPMCRKIMALYPSGSSEQSIQTPYYKRFGV